MTVVAFAPNKFREIDLRSGKHVGAKSGIFDDNIFIICAREQNDESIDDETKFHVIRKVFDSSPSFYSLSYIVRTSKLKKSDVKRILSTSDKFRESEMLTLKGDDVYFLNTPKNRFKNFISSIFYLNYIKYMPWSR